MSKKYIQSKISLLRNFCILTRNDTRTPVVKKVLASKQNEIQVENFLHDIIMGRKTLDQALQEVSL
jgi:hypothetical protein